MSGQELLIFSLIAFIFGLITGVVIARPQIRNY